MYQILNLPEYVITLQINFVESAIDMTEILKVESLNKSYLSHGQSKQAVKGLCFSASSGEILGILGPNGSGKTTTLKSIAGLIEFDEGKITVNGYDNVKQRNQMLFHIGAVLEGARNIYWRLSPLENIIYFAGLKGVKHSKAKEQAYHLLDILELNDKVHDELRNLSKGMQQKVAIACAIVHEPSLILLDEPTLGLDVEIIRKVKPWLKTLALNSNSAILITSHDLNFIEDVCDRVIIIKHGEMIAESSVEELRARHSPQKIIALTIRGEISQRDLQSLNQYSQWDITVNDGNSLLKTTSESLDFLYPVFELLNQQKYTLLDLAVNEDSLEEMFINLIKE